MPQIYRYITEDGSYITFPTSDTPPPRNGRLSPSSVPITTRLDLLHSRRASFSFIPDEFLFRIPHAYLTSAPFFRQTWVSRDWCKQRYIPLSALTYGTETCPSDEIACGVLDTPLNIHNYIEDTPNNPRLIGLIYHGVQQLPFTIPYAYNLNNMFSPSVPYTIWRRELITTQDVKDYLSYLRANGRTTEPPLDQFPPTFRTAMEPLTPTTFHNLTQPFGIETVRPGYDVLIHLETGLPVAEVHPAKLFWAAVDAIVADSGFRAFGQLSREGLIRRVQNETGFYFIDGPLFAEYFLTFRDYILQDIPQRSRPRLTYGSRRDFEVEIEAPPSVEGILVPPIQHP
ncbi:hypothetical protein PQX77_017344 [Marasmius sp. AFHP31]|nr:hypothetical protein PQX77_017344 [Marasmius sp. AFHP31]